MKECQIFINTLSIYFYIFIFFAEGKNKAKFFQNKSRMLLIKENPYVSVRTVGETYQYETWVDHNRKRKHFVKHV